MELLYLALGFNYRGLVVVNSLLGFIQVVDTALETLPDFGYLSLCVGGIPFLQSD